MEVVKLTIANFRGIKSAEILLKGNCVFVGDNNSGKSTIFEALDLVMGPDRLARHPIIDEHDFYAGEYIKDGSPQEIKIESISDILSEVQKSLSSLVSYETADKPQVRVSNFTREHLRKVLTVFMGSGALREDGSSISNHSSSCTSIPTTVQQSAT